MSSWGRRRRPGGRRQEGFREPTRVSARNRESRDLRNQQRDIQADRRDARSDGVVTPKERRRIRNEQKAASKDIYEQKNDDAR
jgi:hypothetical protein